ncbi:hypothetical protein K2173_020732 [Erythroxylum novogranatense]|uniref:Small ribosomal subunit protein bS18c n=1 Tax=Erythroxylum novogranatense TaxID=1862640 RepID=A0AAV8TLS4_9ROSI|nr:hypothetical protein K2173_020732 [Erythroxylum novogranatense]
MGSLSQFVFRSMRNGSFCRFQAPYLVKSLSTNVSLDNSNDDEKSCNSFEYAEWRIFGDYRKSGSGSDPFFQKLDRLEKDRRKYGAGQNESETWDGIGDSFNTLSDGMDGKLKEAAAYFEFDPEEIDEDEYSFRPDMDFFDGSTYDIKDLDLTKPRVTRPPKPFKFDVTTDEVLRKADFRNVRFLANFITEAGIIIKRSKTGISAKAQRKVAREIKTARAFGLMPFTTMGTKSFVFGKTMEDLDEDYQYDIYDTRTFVDGHRGV